MHNTRALEQAHLITWWLSWWTFWIVRAGRVQVKLMTSVMAASTEMSSATVHVHSLTWLVVALDGMKPFVGHTCVVPQDVCCWTHGSKVFYSFLLIQPFTLIHRVCVWSSLAKCWPDVCSSLGFNRSCHHPLNLSNRIYSILMFRYFVKYWKIFNYFFLILVIWHKFSLDENCLGLL